MTHHVQFIVLAFAAFTATAQAPVDSPRLSLAMDQAEVAFADAIAEADQGGRSSRLSSALKEANEDWQRVNELYRDMASPDDKWKADFDSISDHIANAVAMFNRSSSRAAIKTELEQAASILKALRDRNEVAPYEGPLTDAIESLEELRETAEEVRKLRSDIGDVRADFEKAFQEWQEARPKYLSGVELELGPNQLSRARQLALSQDRNFEELSKAIASRRPLLFVLKLKACRETMDALASVANQPGLYDVNDQG